MSRRRPAPDLAIPLAYVYYWRMRTLLLNGTAAEGQSGRLHAELASGNAFSGSG
jgi:hypothetical protein